MPAEPRRILIVRLGSIGDVARVLAILAGLEARFPRAEIDWVVQERAADLLRAHPQVDRLFVVPFDRWRDVLSRRAWRLRRRMRRRDYDLVLDFQGSMKGTVAAFAATGSAVRVGWSPFHAEEGTWLLFHGHRTPPGHRVNRHARFRCLVDWLGVPDVPAVPPDFAVADTERIERFVTQLADHPRPWILAYPGSSRSGSHKRWKPERFERALDEIRDGSGGTVLIGWGPAEREEARELEAAVPGTVLIPSTSIRELACLLARCDLYVGMDTGPMHLAGLVGTPYVGVFGRSDPVLHGPAEHVEGVAVAGPEARYWNTRERRGLEPFAGPDVDRVVEAALGLLEMEDPGRTPPS